mmetsp:Transcript_5619/g.23360  ORF Transcript_5619/g.23360 Transcript_5619/m.23360 type:complete len:224 (-) Transcript_5619:70-741(-)
MTLLFSDQQAVLLAGGVVVVVVLWRAKSPRGAVVNVFGAPLGAVLRAHRGAPIIIFRGGPRGGEEEDRVDRREQRHAEDRDDRDVGPRIIRRAFVVLSNLGGRFLFSRRRRLGWCCSSLSTVAHLVRVIGEHGPLAAPRGETGRVPHVVALVVIDDVVDAGRRPPRGPFASEPLDAVRANAPAVNAKVRRVVPKERRGLEEAVAARRHPALVPRRLAANARRR